MPAQRPETIQQARLRRLADEYYTKAVEADSPVLAERYERLGDKYQRDYQAGFQS